MTSPTPTTIAALLDRHDGVLLDVYGVLFDARGPLPGAAALIAELARRGMPYAIVTNDASRSPATYQRRFANAGIEVAAERFVTSGSLLAGYLRDHDLAGARCFVLGTPDSLDYVRAGGALALPPADHLDIDALAICDDAGFEFLSGAEQALAAVIRAIEAGRRPALILPNPDIVYPKGGGELGFTAGAIAMLVEAGLARRFPSLNLRFTHLGKPEPALFLEAARRLAIPPPRLVMIGDQLETDIAGATAAGVPSALLAAGVSSWEHAHPASALAPTYLLATLQP